MREFRNSNFGRRLSCLALALVMVLSLLPLRADAYTLEDNVSGVTGTAAIEVSGRNKDKVAVTFSEVTLDWYEKDESIGRMKDGWWLGVRVAMPENAVPEKATFTTQRLNGEVSQPVSYQDAKDEGSDSITFWAFVDESTPKDLAANTKKAFQTYTFNWDGNKLTQTISVWLSASVLKLKKDGNVVYDGERLKAFGRVSIPAGYTYESSSLHAPEIELTLTSTVPHQQGGWFADFEITKPESANMKKAQYREKGAEKGTKIGVEKLTVKTLLAWDAESAKTLREKSFTWEFDWAGDGTYEQTVTIHVADAARLERRFEYPSGISASYYVASQKAPLVKTGVEGATQFTAEYIESDGDTAPETKIIGDEVTFNVPGKIKVTASAPDDGIFTAAESSYVFAVKRSAVSVEFANRTPEISFDPKETAQTYRQTVTNAKNREVIYTITEQKELDSDKAANVATIAADGTLTILRSGKVTVKASTAKTNLYEESTASYILTVKRAVDDSLLTFAEETTEEKPAELIYGRTEYTIELDGRGGSLSAELPDGLSEAIFFGGELTVTLNDHATGLFIIPVTRAADEKYEKVTKNYYLRISYAQAPTPAYTMLGDTKNDSGWFTGSVTVSAPEGWEIATGNSLTGETWAEALPVFTKEGVSEAGKVYLRRMNGGEPEITDAIDYAEIKIDRIAPADLTYDVRKVTGEAILEFLTFGWYNASIKFTLTAKDATSGVEKFEYWFVDDSGSVISGSRKEITEVAYNEKTGVYSAEFTLKPEIKGTLHFVAIDKAGNCSKDQEGNEVILEKTPPTLAPEYSAAVRKAGETRYYDSDTPAYVLLKLVDNERLTQKNGDVLAKVMEDGKELQVNWLVHSDGKTATAAVTFSGEGAHHVTVQAWDAAGNEMNAATDLQIIDLTKPVADAQYANPQSSAGDTLYYAGTAEVTLRVVDTNLDKADITVKDNNTEVTGLVWTQDAKDPAVRTAVCTVSGEGKHILTVDAFDLANNKMDTFTSKTLILDQTKPVSGVQYADPQSSLGDTLYYAGAFEVTLRVTDTNLDPAGITVKDNDAPVANLTWTQDANDASVWTAICTVSGEGAHILTMNAHDRSNNEMDTFTSRTLVIDQTRPAAEVKYADPMGSTDDTLYYAGSFTAALKVTDTNLDPADITVKDNGEVVANLAWTQDANDASVWTAVCTVSGEGEHILTMTARDRAKNEMEPYTSPNLLIIDQTPPVSEVKYADPMGGTDDVLYYGGAFEVTLRVTDVNLDPADITVMDNGEVVSGLEWKPEGKRPTVWTAICTVSGEGGHILTMTALDRAKNEMEPFTSKKLIIDETAPIAGAQYAEPKSSTDEKDYYDGAFEVTLHVADTNLDPADITVMDNGEVVSGLVWTQDANDPAVWMAVCTISGEGEHILTMTAHDRAKNEMTPYTSPKILVIDQTAPVINVIYANTDVKNVIDGISYFDREQTATIEIMETNFSAENVTLTVTAKDVTGKDIATEDFLAALRDARKWSHEGSKHTATVSFPVEANYTLTVACTDLAGLASEKYEEDRFTVDTTAPTNLTVSYSTSLLDRVLEGVTFGYYNAPVTVTVTADDAISGVHGIVYSYAKAPNVSGVNAELLNDAISAADIRRNGYTFTATFTIPKTALTANSQFNGTVNFTATDRSGRGMSYADSRRTVVDTIRPAAEVTLTEPAYKEGTTAYYAGTAGVRVRVNEANFYAADVVFEVTKDGAPYPVTADWTDNSPDLHTGVFSLTQEGEYVVRMRYTDRSGNVMEDYVSDTLIVDATAPELTVTGVKADSANKETPFGFVVTAKDKHLDPATLTVTLTAVVRDEAGKYAVKTLALDPVEIVKAGEECRITVKDLKEDAVYSLSCTVADRSGNVRKTFTLHDGKEHEKISFSVNRNGSTFSVDENTAQLLERYYTYEVTENVVIFETNVDPVEHYAVKLNGRELSEGTDYTTTLTTEPGKWALRTYTLNKNLFVTEGGYNVVVESTDKTNTVTYSDVKSLDISFVVDQTAPVLTISGLKTGGRYQTTEQTVTVIPTDDGGRLYSFRALVMDSDGMPLRSESGEDISVRFDLSGEELHEYLKQHDGMITFTVPEGLENQVRLICADCAQHADGTTNVCDELYERVTVSSNLFIIFFANKGLFYGSLAGLAAVLALIIFLIVGKKRKSSKK